MFSAIYIEEAIAESGRAQKILSRFPELPVIICERYGEIFNRRAQNFRLQKQAPALILARKHGKLVLPAPPGYGFEAGSSFYFSHMLNCLYDCRYCFLQGMYRSANYVLFLNYEDFAKELEETISEAGNSTEASGPAVFYSGYDCDSLALEPVSEFCSFFLPLFRQHPEAILEIRTKSTQVRGLLESEPMSNCVLAMSFTTEEISRQLEEGVPSVDKRLEALAKLQAAGWPVAIRFEPILASGNTVPQYSQLFEKVFARLDPALLHSVSTGEFRMPGDYYKNIVRLYPDHELYARPTVVADGMISLRETSAESMQDIEKLLLGYIAPSQYYRCA